MPRKSASRRSSSLWISVVPQMKRTEAIPKPHRSSACWAAAIIAGMVGQAQVVVGAQVEHRGVADADLGGLRRGDHRLGLVQAVGAELGQVVGELVPSVRRTCPHSPQVMITLPPWPDRAAAKACS